VKLHRCGLPEEPADASGSHPCCRFMLNRRLHGERCPGCGRTMLMGCACRSNRLAIRVGERAKAAREEC